MFKINISTKDGKTYKLEAEAPSLKQHKIGDTISGQEISPDLAGYELEITGTSDFAGFMGMKGVKGMGLKGELLCLGKGLHRPPKGDKKKPKKASKGLRIRKTVRGELISDAITQVNTKIVKEGAKSLSEVFTDQNKNAEAKASETESKEPEPKEAPAETKPAEEKKEEAKPTEEKPAETPEQEKSEQVSEAKEAPNEAQPEQEPKESEASKEEKAHPDEQPK